MVYDNVQPQLPDCWSHSLPASRAVSPPLTPRSCAVILAAGALLLRAPDVTTTNTAVPVFVGSSAN